MTRFTIAPLLLILAPTVGNAQERAYEPSHDNPTGEEIVLVFLSSSWCAGSRAPGLHDAIEEAKLTMADRADADAVGFRALGIGLDWATADAIGYLREFGAFDELIVGSNWFNLGVEEMIWEDQGTDPTIPQLIIFRREIAVDRGPRPTFGERRILKRVAGAEQIVDWVQAGIDLQGS